MTNANALKRFLKPEHLFVAIKKALSVSLGPLPPSILRLNYGLVGDLIS